MTDARTPLLDVRGVTKRFGGLTAVKDLSLRVPTGSLFGLIGPNGAGKTTIFNLLTGVYRPTDGQILFGGHRVDGRRPYEIASLGMTRTFQNIRLFPDMTVLENVMTARHLRSRQWLADAVIGTPRHRREERRTHERARELLAIFGLDALATCRTAASAGSRSRARWRPSRSCCCSTSRPRA
jgi:branched-chain amino acid transport system ATP-binding protein